MSIRLAKKELNQTLLGAMLVATAVFVKNGGTQMLKNTGRKLPNILGMDYQKYGMLLFMLGWSIVGYSLSSQLKSGTLKMNMKTMLALSGSAGVLAGVYLVKTFQPNTKSQLQVTLKRYGGMLFIAGWMAVAYASTLERAKMSRMMALVALGSVLASMLYVLPRQREQSIVDGPGMFLFAMAWMTLAGANASK